MKRMAVMVVLMAVSAITSAQVPPHNYDDLDISFEQFMQIANLGEKSPRVKALISKLTRYDDYLTDEFRPQFKALILQAAEDGYRVRDAESIPVLVAVNSGCIEHAVTALKDYDGKYLEEDAVYEYALVMACAGLMDRLEQEVDSMRYMNGEYINAQGYESKAYRMWSRPVQTKRDVFEETTLYLRFLIPEETNEESNEESD